MYVALDENIAVVFKGNINAIKEKYPHENPTERHHPRILIAYDIALPYQCQIRCDIPDLFVLCTSNEQICGFLSSALPFIDLNIQSLTLQHSVSSTFNVDVTFDKAYPALSDFYVLSCTLLLLSKIPMHTARSMVAKTSCGNEISMPDIHYGY